MGYIYRTSNVDMMGVYVKKGSLRSGSLSFNSTTLLKEGTPPPNIRIAAKGNKAYAAIDDNGRGFSHCHAYTFDGVSWKPYGENQLPYFKGPFQASHGYNLYGFAPQIAIDNNGGVYISMISWPSSGSTSKNNGPIVMKNISGNWTINTKP